jgi:very-short-patch-repair endonuclease
MRKNLSLQERAKSMRKSLTEAESILWHALKGRKIKGVKFRRQHIFQNYIVDFISISHKLIIEVDGLQHLAQAEYDAIRTDFFKAGGYTILRFWNHEILNHLESVLERIVENIHSTSLTPR